MCIYWTCIQRCTYFLQKYLYSTHIFACEKQAKILTRGASYHPPSLGLIEIAARDFIYKHSFLLFLHFNKNSQHCCSDYKRNANGTFLVIELYYISSNVCIWCYSDTLFTVTMSNFPPLINLKGHFVFNIPV